MRHLLLAALLAGVLVPAAAFAAEGGPTPDTLTVTVPGIIVTALRGRDRIADVPSATFVLDRAELRRNGMSRLSTLLQSLPGLYGSQQRSSADVGVIDPRGFTASGESSYLQLRLDGMDVRDVENGNVDWDWVLPEDVERVEVVQGAGAWLYGDGTQGGIVNIVRPDPSRLAAEGRAWDSECAVRAGSFGLWTGSLDLGGVRGGDSGRLRGSIRSVDGWRDHSHDRAITGGAEARRRFGGGTTLSLTGTVLDSDRQNPGTLTADQIIADRTQSETTTDYDRATRTLLGGRLDHGTPGAAGWALGVRGKLEDADQLRTLFFQPKFHPTQSGTVGGDAEGRSQTSLGGRSQLWTVGFEIERSGLDSKYDDFDPAAGVGAEVSSVHSTRTGFAMTAGSRIALTDRTVARLAVRGDLVKIHAADAATGSTPTRTLKAASPLIALSQQIGARGSAYASFSTAFRVPTLNQLYDKRPIDVAPGVTVSLSNAQLDPQRSVNTEIGGRIDGANGASASLALYSIWVHDEIDFDLATLSYANISSSWHRGIEASLRSAPMHGVSGVLSGTWSPTTFSDGGSIPPEQEEKQINGVPESTGYAGLLWSFVPAATVEFAARFTGDQFLDKVEEHPLKGVGVVDVGLSGRLARVRGAVRVTNVFDREYSDTGFIGALGEERFSPAAPRAVTVSVSLD